MKKIIKLSACNISDWILKSSTSLYIRHWKEITHIIIECLIFEGDEIINIKDDEIMIEVFGFKNICTFTHYFEMLKIQYPHIQFGFSFINLPLFSTKWIKHFKNIYLFLKKYPIVSFVLYDYNWFIHDFHFPLTSINIYLILPNSWEIGKQIFYHLLNSTDYIILNSFKQIRHHLKPEFFPESSIEDFMTNYKFWKPKLFNTPILMGLSTEAAEYVDNEFNRLIPYNELIFKKHFHHFRSYTYRYSYLEKDNIKISFDDEFIVREKLELGKVLNLDGFLLGDINDDLPYKSRNSVWTQLESFS